MSLSENVAALQTRIADAERAAARAQGVRDSATAAAEQARAELRQDFGVDTIAQAETLLADLRNELEHLTDAISAKLDEIGV